MPASLSFPSIPSPTAWLVFLKYQSHLVRSCLNPFAYRQSPPGLCLGSLSPACTTRLYFSPLLPSTPSPTIFLGLALDMLIHACVRSFCVGKVSADGNTRWTLRHSPCLHGISSVTVQPELGSNKNKAAHIWGEWVGGGLRVFQAEGTAWMEAGRAVWGTHLSPVNAGRGV